MSLEQDFNNVRKLLDKRVQRDPEFRDKALKFEESIDDADKALADVRQIREWRARFSEAEQRYLSAADRPESEQYHKALEEMKELERSAPPQISSYCALLSEGEVKRTLNEMERCLRAVVIGIGGRILQTGGITIDKIPTIELSKKEAFLEAYNSLASLRWAMSRGDLYCSVECALTLGRLIERAQSDLICELRLKDASDTAHDNRVKKDAEDAVLYKDLLESAVRWPGHRSFTEHFRTLARNVEPKTSVDRFKRLVWDKAIELGYRPRPRAKGSKQK